MGASSFNELQTHVLDFKMLIENVSKYHQEIPQAHTTDQPTAPQGRA